VQVTGAVLVLGYSETKTQFMARFLYVFIFEHLIFAWFKIQKYKLCREKSPSHPIPCYLLFHLRGDHQCAEHKWFKNSLSTKFYLGLHWKSTV
jgi:hypothetical protein